VTVQEENFDRRSTTWSEQRKPIRVKENLARVAHRLALMDHRVGETIEADTPGGKIKLKILKIE